MNCWKPAIYMSIVGTLGTLNVVIDYFDSSESTTLRTDDSLPRSIAVVDELVNIRGRQDKAAVISDLDTAYRSVEGKNGIPLGQATLVPAKEDKLNKSIDPPLQKVRASAEYVDTTNRGGDTVSDSRASSSDFHARSDEGLFASIEFFKVSLSRSSAMSLEENYSSTFVEGYLIPLEDLPYFELYPISPVPPPTQIGQGISPQELLEHYVASLMR